LARLELAGEVAPFAHLLDERLGDGDLRGRRSVAGTLPTPPEAPIVVEKRSRTHREEKQEHAPQPSARPWGGSFGRRRGLGPSGRRFLSLQVRCRLLGLARGRLVLRAAVAASVPLLHRGRIQLVRGSPRRSGCIGAILSNATPKTRASARGQTQDRNCRLWPELLANRTLFPSITPLCASPSLYVMRAMSL